jgi:predicted transcriptional regulator
MPPIDQIVVFEASMDLVRNLDQRNPIPAEQLEETFRQVHAAMRAMAGLTEEVPTALPRSGPEARPAGVAGHDYLICLEDGTYHRMLKRYLLRSCGLTPDQYRTKWGLPPDAPMVAPAYKDQDDFYRRCFGEEVASAAT